MEPLRFGTEDGVSLEGELRRPETPAVGSAVICHAHPRHGGSKDHPILWALRNELASRGFVVLAFNFRGTMRSAGTYGAGHTEVKDVAAAIGRVREEAEGPTIVCGWSFGANVALREGDVYCPRPRLEALARTMPKAEVVIVPGTDHFLWHREKAVAETVGSFAVRTLLSADGRPDGRQG